MPGTQKQQKTIFIIVGRGFIAKTILRSGALTHLKKTGSRIVLFFYDVHNVGVPQHLRREFEDDQVVVESVQYPRMSPLHRRFWIATSVLVYNVGTRHLRSERVGRSTFLFFLEKLFFVPLSRLHVLKYVVRFVEQRLRPYDSYGAYFDRYRPDVVFSTSIISKVDLEFMKEARRRGTPTVSMPRGWDNVSALMYKFVPDRLIVQNELMKKDAIKMQAFPPKVVHVTGFPQFDWYRRPEVITSREEHLASLGLDPKRKLIVWGSTGMWTPNDKNICEVIADLVSKDTLAVPASLLIRAYPREAAAKRFELLRGLRHVAIDDSFTTSDFFQDRIDPSTSELVYFTNTIYHADLLITLCSTLTFDALCTDTPVINTAFKGFYDKKGRDISPVLYLHGHYRKLLELGAVDLVHSEEELIESINQYLLHPEHKREERKKALDLLCYKIDGNASRRAADIVTSVL